jgi:ribosomal protein S1
MNYRKVKAVVAATVTLEVEIEVEVLIAEWPIPVAGDAHNRIMWAVQDKIKANPPKFDPSKAKPELTIKSSNMKQWKW